MRHFLNHVRALRSATDESQGELARAVGVSRQTIAAIEKGNYVPSVALALELSKHYKRQVEELFYWKE